MWYTCALFRVRVLSMYGGRYALSVRAFHWVMALAVAGLVALGFCMTNMSFPDNSAKRQLYTVHKACGIAVLAMLPVRLLSRLRSKVPPYSNKVSRASVILAKVVHFSLYVLMFCIPVSGYLMSSASGYPVSMWYFTVPAMIPKDESVASMFSAVHEVSVFALMAVVALHVLGALKHTFFDGDNVFKRII
ncbi:MAG: cytochrome b [Anaplasma sp.]